jgi:MFS-type transporter involved in bile tolerance (Atg22 family)
MTVMFVGLGSAADYGSFGRWLLLVLTVVCWVFQYGMMAIRNPSQWPAAMVLYIIAYIAYVSLPYQLLRHEISNAYRVQLWSSMPPCSQG